jgi:hypothetical protein
MHVRGASADHGSRLSLHCSTAPIHLLLATFALAQIPNYPAPHPEDDSFEKAMSSTVASRAVDRAARLKAAAEAAPPAK